MWLRSIPASVFTPGARPDELPSKRTSVKLVSNGFLLELKRRVDLGVTISAWRAGSAPMQRAHPLHLTP